MLCPHCGGKIETRGRKYGGVRQRVLQLLPMMNNTQIAKEVKVSRERVRQIRKEYNISSPFFRQTCSVITEEMLGLIIKDLDSNMSMVDMKKKYHMSSLPKLLDRYGISYKHRHFRTKNSLSLNGGKGRRFTKEQILEAYEKFKDKKYIRREMSNYLGTQYVIIDRWLVFLKEAGYDVNTDNIPNRYQKRREAKLSRESKGE